MPDLLHPFRRGRDDHREIFAQFATQLVFVIAAAIAAKRGQARLRIVR